MQKMHGAKACQHAGPEAPFYNDERAPAQITGAPKKDGSYQDRCLHEHRNSIRGCWVHTNARLPCLWLGAVRTTIRVALIVRVTEKCTVLVSTLVRKGTCWLRRDTIRNICGAVGALPM